MRYAHAVAAWGDAGGYHAEVHWNECTTRAVGLALDEIAGRPLRTFSGGEQKRLALEVLLRSDADVLLLDEPDNFLDVEAKRWLEGELRATRKTVLYISHDRELLAATATKIVTIEGPSRVGGPSGRAWTFGGSFAGYADARRAHLDKLDKDRALYDEERKRLEDLVAEMRRRARYWEVFAPKLKAAESRLRQFVEREERPAEVREQRIAMRLGGARTGKRALVVQQLELDGLTDPFDLEVDFGERVAVLGANGAGKSHFLRLLAGEGVEHHGSYRLGAGVVPGLFHQTHEHPRLARQVAARHPPRPRRRPRTGDGHAAPLRARTAAPSSRSRRCRVVSRRGSRSSCWNGPERRCCCSTSRPTTSTSCPPRRWRPGSPSSPGRCSPSPTTAGSCAASTASWSSAPTAR